MKVYFDNINRIFNSYNSGKKISLCNYSNFTMLLLNIFHENNFLENYYLLIINNKKYIIVLVKNIFYLKFFSKPSNKIFIKYKNINNFLFNASIGIINTNFGLMTIKECKKIGIGGILLLIIL
ncbi:30S ribosomal protein S8 [Candidatus Carsonella ruddii]|uniref:Small ribosomal subunit protein uS8 n=3 Tax=cellular organisms TaxID=131567 RepID=A0AAJ6FDF8_CARRU|nr:30S ribosomal protein S8 [Candidatus Carsonella ruddii]WGS66633.1 30S ribosomal protein S8 [Candidatus Carsonella ruddii]WGS66830.1 30S ribosomal protein S8 [Candidatus Carsonella ruddii]WGS67022.1 30S ribosomal protein S8 [Candidatus Carsonella ruddii]WGS67213.1 30S ribosomal protein S8 [Candidatus Carsonella ruddii]WMC18231.1 MAG: 30S ribosomal protein S8 [Candidatus Carsonella ruddii]